jgi:hypothetical protein
VAELLAVVLQVEVLQVVVLLVVDPQVVALKVVLRPVEIHQNQPAAKVHYSLRCSKKWSALRHSWVEISHTYLSILYNFGTWNGTSFPFHCY